MIPIVKPIACLLVIYPLAAAQDTQAAEPPCLEQLAAFAQGHRFELHTDKAAIDLRRVAAGHEVRTLPGHTITLPVDQCNGAVFLDFAPNCQLLKSRGDGGCKIRFPVTIY